MVIPNNLYTHNAISALRCPWCCLEEHYIQHWSGYLYPQMFVLMYGLLFVTVFIFVVMLPVTFDRVYVYISNQSTVAWILLYCVFECIICEPITSDDLISHTWTLTSFTICISQCSCCQEGICAGFSHSFTTETKRRGTHWFGMKRAVLYLITAYGSVPVILYLFPWILGHIIFSHVCK